MRAKSSRTVFECLEVHTVKELILGQMKFSIFQLKPNRVCHQALLHISSWSTVYTMVSSVQQYAFPLLNSLSTRTVRGRT